ncbi:MAG: hypothetical protein ABS76_07825 [Pelagibacterium sp. SCN 64-44]|nr:MAG: hypothetical protein ABS76_07825 [Pelagibacterium sp. SCN 64-44]
MRFRAFPFTKLLVAFLAGLFGILIFLPELNAMDFPREGHTDIPNGVAAPFAGRWWIGFPEGEGMINGEPVVSCSSAVELVPQEHEKLLYRSSRGVKVLFELLEFSGRTTWLPESGESIIAVWVNEGEFFAYSVDLTTGKARWADPTVYRRC